MVAKTRMVDFTHRKSIIIIFDDCKKPSNPSRAQKANTSKIKEMRYGFFSIVGFHELQCFHLEQHFSERIIFY